jgi:hypothetical protein
MTGPLGKRISVAELGLAILAGVQEHYAASDLTLPDRQYLAPGNPEEVAWDCEQLVVALTGIGWGQAEDQSSLAPKPGAQVSVNALRHAIFSVQIVRCTPKPEGRNATFPTVEAVHEAGIVFMQDAGMISQALVVIASRMRQGLSGSGLVEPGVVNMIGPSGGLHAVEGTIAITSGVLT